MNYFVNYFPFQTDSDTANMKRCSTVEDTAISTMKTFLLTIPGTRLGSMTGSMLPLMLFNAYTDSALKAESVNLKKELIGQFPEFIYNDVQIVNKIMDGVSGLLVTINFSLPYADATEFSLFLETRQ